jgi:hypothetical protein
VKENLRRGQYLALDARWKMIIELMEGEDLNTGMSFRIFLEAIPTKEEIHDLSNIWSRSVKWTVSFRMKSSDFVIRQWTVLPC